MFHCGSRGFGHQIATDYLSRFLKVMTRQYGIEMPDRELACAPIESQDGRDYFSAMKCAVNMAFANRQVILHRVREVFSEVLHRDPADLGMSQIYDVCHNIARLETHQIAGRDRLLLIHRKGATRTLPPGAKQLPEIYRSTGQPVIIGGSMETGSYLLAGIETADKSFYTTAHGSGRVLSRRQARRTFNGGQLIDKMKDQGIYIRCVSKADLAEEAGAAYKDINEVVKATAMAGISKPVARFIPIGNIKG
jgi:tRNA-splicing ligase RtcB